MTRIVATPAPGNTEPTIDKDRPRLLDQVKEALRYRHYSLRTERTYIHWIKRYIYFHKLRHPREMGAQEVTQFLSFLAVEGEVSSSTQNQALAALLFLYKQVLDIELPWMDDITRSKRPKRLPTVLTRNEVTALLNHVSVRHALMARMIYGSGLRLMECQRLRVKDLDLERRELVVREGKGGKDRITLVPDLLVDDLRLQLRQIRPLFDQDRAQDQPGVALPAALERKYPSAGKTWAWFWVFPSPTLSVDPRSGIRRRHHAHETAFQRAIKQAAANAKLSKPVSTHTLRHSFATHLLEAGYDCYLLPATVQVKPNPCSFYESFPSQSPARSHSMRFASLSRGLTSSPSRNC